MFVSSIFESYLASLVIKCILQYEAVYNKVVQRNSVAKPTQLYFLHKNQSLVTEATRCSPVRTQGIHYSGKFQKR